MDEIVRSSVAETRNGLLGARSSRLASVVRFHTLPRKKENVAHPSRNAVDCRRSREPQDVPDPIPNDHFSHRDAVPHGNVRRSSSSADRRAPFPNMDLSETPASLWDLANRINWASGAFRRRQLDVVARRRVALKAVKSCYMRVAAISSVPQVGVLILTGHPLGHEKENSGCRLVATPKCSRALASTLPAAPASFAQVYPQVVGRERVPVTTVVCNLGGRYLAAAVSARERNDERAISRNHPPPRYHTHIPLLSQAFSHERRPVEGAPRRRARRPSAGSFARRP